MKIKPYYLLLLSPLAFTACLSNTSRIETLESNLGQVEEKVDALLVYSDKTHDAISDVDLRMEALEQDAKKRGVPVRIRGIDLDAAKAELLRSQGITPEMLAPLAQQTPQNPPVSPNLNNTLGQASSEQLAQEIPTQDMANEEKPVDPNKPVIVNPPDDAGNINPKNIPFEYPEHTQTSSSPSVPNQEAGAITGQNLQNQGVPQSILDSVQAQNSGNATSQTVADPLPNANPNTPPLNPVTPPLNPTSEQVAQIPPPVSLTPKPTPKPSTHAKPVTASTGTMPASYDSAMSLYNSHRYQEAELAFDAFLTASPNGPLAPNALYWKGETLYARGLYPQAIFAFKEVQTRFPKHAKAPDSLLKTAMSYENLGDVENANLHYTVLKEDFPNSSAAKRAK